MTYTARDKSRSVPGSVGVTETRAFELPAALPLDCGRSLATVTLAYETYGTLSAACDNAILVCHALSGDAHAAGWSADPTTPTALDGVGADERGAAARAGLGWWDGMVGPGKAFDTNRYFVVCSNVIGGCRGSTGPSSTDPATGRPYALDFPAVTVGDMVRAQTQLIDALGVDTLLAVSGGSLGGMQALEWAANYPERVRACIPIASTARLGSQGVAWNAIARNAIMADPNWQGGAYYATGRVPLAGIGVARMVGHVTYLSAASMAEKFGRRLQAGDKYSYRVDGADFAVESYLRHQAAKFAARFDANSYLYLSRALTYFDLARPHGGSLARALRDARAAFLLLAFSSDWLYPPADSAELHDALRRAGKAVEFHTIETTYGHDSFLLEEPRQTPLIAEFLERVYASSASRPNGTERHNHA